MIKVLFSICFIIISPFPVKAETYCQNVNKTGQVVNAAPLALTANKYLKRKGVDYKSSPQEISTTIKNYCSSNPYATVDDATDHLVNILQVAAELLR